MDRHLSSMIISVALVLTLGSRVGLGVRPTEYRLQDFDAAKVMSTGASAKVHKVDLEEATQAGAPDDGILGLVQSLQGRGTSEAREAAGLIEKLFGGLVEAGQVESSEQPEGQDSLSVVLSGANGAGGEIATKSRVPLEVLAEKTMTAKVEELATGALALHVTGLFFEPVADMAELYTKAMSYRPTAEAGKCSKECAGSSTALEAVLECDKCVAYEWYKANKDDPAQVGGGKLARILKTLPITNPALSLEFQQGDWTPSRVGDKQRRRIIYSLLAAEPARVNTFLFGSVPAAFGAPPTKTEKGKEVPIYGKSPPQAPYVSAVTELDFHGNTELQTLFEENNLAEKVQLIGKESLIGKLGTTYDKPLDDAEFKLKMGTSGINFARMVASGKQALQSAKIFVRPAIPAKVMKMLGNCNGDPAKEANIDTGCSGGNGRLRWTARE